eukprot:9411665-Alexandrium_andersonii.AAC.1
MLQQPETKASPSMDVLGAHGERLVLGSRRRSSAVLKTFQHRSHTSKLGGPGSSCRTHVSEAML